MKKIIAFSLLAGLLAANALAAEKFADFSAPTAIAFGPKNEMHVTEWSADRITTIWPDGTRTARAVGISAPAGICRNSSGQLFVAGYGDGNIYQLAANGLAKPIAGGFQQPTGLFCTEIGSLLVANRGAGEIVELWPDGHKKIVSSGHKLPVGVATDANGGLFISCYGGSVDYVDKNGKTHAFSNGFSTPGVGLAPAGPDSAYGVDNSAGTIFLANSKGERKTLASGLKQPVALAVMPNGNLLVGEWGTGTVKEVELKNE